MSSLIRKLLQSPTNNILIQLFRYTFVGGFAFVIDFGLLICLTEFLGLHYLLSATISFIAGLVVNYLISIKWVFDSSSIKKRYVEFLFFALIGVVGLGINNLILYLLTDLCLIPYGISKLIAAIGVFLWNFIARRLLLFNSKININNG